MRIAPTYISRNNVNDWIPETMTTIAFVSQIYTDGKHKPGSHQRLSVFGIPQ